MTYTMRSAVHYPDITVQNKQQLKTALLLWDKLYVIVPDKYITPHFEDGANKRAWDIVGGLMVPTPEQRQIAHNKVIGLFEAGGPAQASNWSAHSDPSRTDYRMYAGKLAHETWHELQARGLAKPAAGDWEVEPTVALAIMAKLADACAGNDFARTTDRFQAYGIMPERHTDTMADWTIVPMALDLVDCSSLPFDALLDFREREQSDQSLAELRRRYADFVHKQIAILSDSDSAAGFEERKRFIRQQMETDLADLRDGLRLGKRELIFSSAVVSVAVAGGSWLANAGADPVALTMFSAPVVASVFEKFSGVLAEGFKFGSAQRQTIKEHPMAYMYALSEARFG